MEFFNPKLTSYKSINHALKQGDTIVLRICMPRDYRCEGASLVYHLDGDKEHKKAMHWSGMCGEEHEWWGTEFSAGAEGLYWYHFEYSVPYSGGVIKKGKNSECCTDEEGNEWQITVFKKDFKTPDWIKGGIIYQIFPDRFAIGSSGVKNPYNDRIIRTDYEADPYWEPVNGKYNCDYFGGNLEGIKEKFPYLKELGINCIYLNPIFEAHSNHRYDTADYSKIDGMLGDEEDFKTLCAEARKLDIHIILDGVFSHVGQDSIYFNMYRRYPGDGAYNSQSSPYYNWFKFNKWPDDYESWWGIRLLPEIKEETPAFLDYICGKKGIVRKWLALGADGWRLDVADELPDVFLDSLRTAAKEEKSDALILGEVWEDATNKVAYSQRRRYLLGDQLDCVMNYPFADAIIDFVRNGNSEKFFGVIEGICENYPPEALACLMNHIGTHDTPRAITSLAGEDSAGKGRPWQSTHKLNEEQKRKGVSLLKLASLIQFTLPGVPSIYYGDEIGMEGYSDPFNRRFFDEKRANADLLEWYKALGKLRNNSPVLAKGIFKRVWSEEGTLCFIRKFKGNEMLVALNRDSRPLTIDLPEEYEGSLASLGKSPKGNRLTLESMEYSVIEL